MGIDDDAGLADEVPVMRVEVFIFPHFIDNPQEVMKELFVSAVVETFQVFLYFGHFHQGHDNF